MGGQQVNETTPAVKNDQALGCPNPRRSLAIYAHYDAKNEVKRYVVFFLRCLREWCDRIAFVSTSPLPPAELDKVRPFCAETFLTENLGYDFSM